MTQDLKTVRRTLKVIVSNLGHQFCMSGKDWMKKATVHTEVRRYADRFVISIGVDHTLSQEERSRIWETEGRRLFDTLKLAGLKPDNTPWGVDQFRIMTFEA